MNLNQITIPVSNVESSIAFYEKLGLILIVSALPRYARFECEVGGNTLSLHQVDKVVESNFWIYFECENLDDKIDTLINNGIVIDDLPKDQPWLWREARVLDLDGNILIFYFAGQNRRHPPWRI